jgi:hypothetical protein
MSVLSWSIGGLLACGIAAVAALGAYAEAHRAPDQS